jgi:uncharacterized peroxidase-related enzyme
MWIKTLPEDEATGVLKEAYSRQRGARGRVEDFTMLGSLYPELSSVRLSLYKVVDDCPSRIPEWAKYAIALTTSVLNRTPHCASGLGERLQQTGMDRELVEAIYADPLGARTGDDAVDPLLDYVRRLVIAPWEITEDDIHELRRHGWDDLDILDANNISAYYCYINRVANGLGLTALTCPAPDMPDLTVVISQGDQSGEAADRDRLTSRSYPPRRMPTR